MHDRVTEREKFRKVQIEGISSRREVSEKKIGIERSQKRREKGRLGGRDIRKLGKISVAERLSRDRERN